MEKYGTVWNCLQGSGTASKLIELYESLCICMQAHGTACKLMKLYARSWNSMQGHGTAYCMQAHLMPWNLGKPWVTLGNLWLLWGTMGKDEKLTKCKVKNFGYK